MPAGYPVVLDLAGRPVVVAGGGPVAERKARGLLDAGAQVTVISPRLSDGLAALVGAGEVGSRLRPWRAGDARGAALAVAATGDPQVDAAVAAEAGRLGILVSVPGDPGRGSFTTPAVLRRGDLLVAVATSARAPGLAGALRRRLERAFGPEWEGLVAALAAERDSLPPAADHAAWNELLADRVVEEILDAVRRGERDAVHERIRACRSSSSA